jgi:hypothetical protein
VATTLHEAEATWLALTLSPVSTAAGLYGGTLTLAGSSGFRLAGYAVAPSTRVSGRLTIGWGSRLPSPGRCGSAGRRRGRSMSPATPSAVSSADGAFPAGCR